MKRIKLRLTGVSDVITEAAEKKLEKGETYQVPTCNNGKTAEFYDDIGIPLPPDLVEKLKKQEKIVCKKYKKSVRIDKKESCT